MTDNLKGIVEERIKKLKALEEKDPLRKNLAALAQRDAGKNIHSGSSYCSVPYKKNKSRGCLSFLNFFNKSKEPETPTVTQSPNPALRR